MEPVGIFVGVDQLDNAVTVQARGQRQLHQNAVDCGILVKLADEVFERLLIGRFWKRVLNGIESTFFGNTPLRSYVGVTCGIVSDNHDREAGP